MNSSFRVRARALKWALLSLVLSTASVAQAQEWLKRVEIPGEPGATAGWGVGGWIVWNDGFDDHFVYFDSPTSGSQSHPVTATSIFDKTKMISTPVETSIHAHGFGASDAKIAVNELTLLAQGTSSASAYPQWSISEPGGTGLNFTGDASGSHTARYTVSLPAPGVNYEAYGGVFVEAHGNQSWNSTQMGVGSVDFGPGISSFSLTSYSGMMTPDINYIDTFGNVIIVDEPYPGYADSIQGYPAEVIGTTFDVRASATAGGAAEVFPGVHGGKSGNQFGIARYEYEVF